MLCVYCVCIIPTTYYSEGTTPNIHSFQILSAVDGRPKEILVRDVDDGEEITVSLEELRLLPRRFMSQHVLTITVELSGLAPPLPPPQGDPGPTPGQWNEESMGAVIRFLCQYKYVRSICKP